MYTGTLFDILIHVVFLGYKSEKQLCRKLDSKDFKERTFCVEDSPFVR